MNAIFIGDKTNPTIGKFADELAKFNKRADEEIDFLKKRAESLDKEKASLFETLLDDLKNQNLVENKISFSTHSLSLNRESGQLFIEEIKQSDFLSALMGMR